MQEVNLKLFFKLWKKMLDYIINQICDEKRVVDVVHVVKEAMEYKLERLNTTLIRSIYNTPIYNRLMYCPGTRLTTNLRATSKEVTWRVIYIIYSTLTGPVSRGF